MRRILLLIVVVTIMIRIIILILILVLILIQILIQILILIIVIRIVVSFEHCRRCCSPTIGLGTLSSKRAPQPGPPKCPLREPLWFFEKVGFRV